MTQSPFHPGEHILQARAGMRDQIEKVGLKVIRDFMPDQHRAFFAQLPWLFVGSVDESGNPWASVLAGPLGFASSPDPKTLSVAALPAAWDVLAGNLRDGAPVGLLGLQFETRRRNRMNGWVRNLSSSGFDIEVGQSFGNCPKYINTRAVTFEGDAHGTSNVLESGELTAAHEDMIRSADTFFIASSHLGAPDDPARGVDVSHRGGKPGFVRIEEDGALTIPDYAGNYSFNTFGNIEADGRAGLLFLDLSRNGILQLTGKARVEWDGPDIDPAAGIHRVLRFNPSRIRFVSGGLPISASGLDLSPHLEKVEPLK